MDKSIFDDTKLPIFFRECEGNKNSEHLIIAMTSHGASGKWYDFYKVLRIYNKAHQLFMSSLDDRYYMKSIGNDWNENTITCLIKDIIQTYNIKKIITLGNSAAGTGAIVWGYRCAEFIKTSIVAGAPFNTLDHPKSFNLEKEICEVSNPKYKDNFTIYLDEEFLKDYNNILPLFKYMNHIHVPHCKHNVMKELYLSGKLFEILDYEINSTKTRIIPKPENWYCKEINFKVQS